MAELADSGLCDHFEGGHNIGVGRTLDNWIFLKKIFQFFATKFSSKSFSITLHRNCTKNDLGHFTQDFLYKFFLVFSNYFQNEMRYAKMKSFRLNRILSRVFEQSFEEILEPSVVVVVVVAPFHLQ